MHLVKLSNIKFKENHSVVLDLFYTDRWTDMMKRICALLKLFYSKHTKKKHEMNVARREMYT
jgi:hypothetical protein